MKVTSVLVVLFGLVLAGCASAPKPQEDKRVYVLTIPGLGQVEGVNPSYQADGSVCITPSLTTKRLCVKTSDYMLVGQ